jgi:hypothetical protein
MSQLADKERRAIKILRMYRGDELDGKIKPFYDQTLF